MKRSIEDVNETFVVLQKEEKLIREDRGVRYGGKDDTLENIATFGSDGAIVAFWECAMRIKNMFGKPKNLMDMRNAVNDSRNYAGMALRIEADEQATEVEMPIQSSPQVTEWKSPEEQPC